MKCNNCGTENDANLKYCRKCGARLVEDNSCGYVNVRTKKDTKDTNGVAMGMFIVGAVILIGFGISKWWYGNIAGVLVNIAGLTLPFIHKGKSKALNICALIFNALCLIGNGVLFLLMFS